uniref:Sushi domain-containing protein n=1 Tax=Oryzias sinensis TaxID=183150 RepID=A0A8C7XJ78_9TELE
MWILSFLLLTWFPAVLHAQGAAGSCPRPELTHGFLVPDQQSYPEYSVTYACDDGFKSAMESWWGTTTCQNGKWFPEPFCIDQNSCVPPKIPGGKCSTTSGWFEENEKLTVDCDPGYRLTKAFPQPTCIKGSWTSIPTCEKKRGACDRPPKISNATILHEASQEVFAEGSQLRYECKEGHNTEDGKTQESISCRAGWWMTPLPCSRVSKYSGTPVENCGEFPIVENGLVEKSEPLALRVRCQHYYELYGPEKVVCYNNNKWSVIPTCKANYCSVNTDDYSDIIPAGVKFITNGEKIELECKNLFYFTSFRVVRCINGKATVSRSSKDTLEKRCYFKSKENLQESGEKI